MTVRPQDLGDFNQVSVIKVGIWLHLTQRSSLHWLPASRMSQVPVGDGRTILSDSPNLKGEPRWFSSLRSQPGSASPLCLVQFLSILGVLPAWVTTHPTNEAEMTVELLPHGWVRSPGPDVITAGLVINQSFHCSLWKLLHHRLDPQQDRWYRKHGPCPPGTWKKSERCIGVGWWRRLRLCCQTLHAPQPGELSIGWSSPGHKTIFPAPTSSFEKLYLSITDVQ